MLKGFVSGFFIATAVSAIAIVPDNPIGTVPGVGKIGSVSGTVFTVGGTAVAVSPTWILTAAHVGGDKFDQNGVVFQVVQSINHPTADLSLRRVVGPLNTALPMKLNYFPGGVPTVQTNLLGEILKLQGMGWTGNRIATGFTAITGTQGILRQCRNRVDLFIPQVQVDIGGGVIKTTDYVFYDLDDPLGQSLVNILGGPAVGPDEGGMSTFDSGCPWTIFENGRDRVLAIGGIIGFFNGTGVTRALDWGGFGGGALLQSVIPWLAANVNDLGRAILNPVQMGTGQVTGGSAAELYLSDNIYLNTQTRTTDVDSIDQMVMTISGVTTASPATTLTLTIEGRAGPRLSWCAVEMRNQVTNLMVNVGGFFLSNNDIVQTIQVPSPANFVRSDGAAELRLRVNPVSSEVVLFNTKWDAIRITAQ
jgi:hypothetical protein